MVVTRQLLVVKQGFSAWSAKTKGSRWVIVQNKTGPTQQEALGVSKWRSTLSLNLAFLLRDVEFRSSRCFSEKTPLSRCCGLCRRQIAEIAWCRHLVVAKSKCKYNRRRHSEVQFAVPKSLTTSSENDSHQLVISLAYLPILVSWSCWTRVYLYMCT